MRLRHCKRWRVEILFQVSHKNDDWLNFPSYNPIKKTVISFCQNWEDTEGRKKLSKVNARVSKKSILSERCSSFINTLKLSWGKYFWVHFHYVKKVKACLYWRFGKWRIEVKIHVSWITLYFNMKIFFLQALATLRQKLRKYNKDFEEDILKYREVSLTFIIHLRSIQAESPIRPELIPVSIAWSD